MFIPLHTPMHVSLLLFFLLGKHQEFFESPKICRNCLTECKGLTKEGTSLWVPMGQAQVYPQSSLFRHLRSDPCLTRLW